MCHNMCKFIGDSSSNVGIIAGAAAAVGGIIMAITIVLIIFIVCYLGRRKSMYVCVYTNKIYVSKCTYCTLCTYIRMYVRNCILELYNHLDIESIIMIMMIVLLLR